MEKFKIKYRTWHKAIAPKPIKLQIPGWAGEPNNHTDGDKPQPWHCPPFVDGATYGLELCYPFDTECRVTFDNNKVIFSGDFQEESKDIPNVPLPPFMSFAPGHFGMTSGLDIKVPTGYVLRIEPHPRFYMDTTNTVPLCIPGHLQTEWWSKIFFVVFKNPVPNQTLIFRKNEPYAQCLIIPRKAYYDIEAMTPNEINERLSLDLKITNNCKKFVKNDWNDHLGQNFDDKYKVLSSIYAKSGMEGIQSFLKSFYDKVNLKSKIAKKFIKRKNESV